MLYTPAAYTVTAYHYCINCTCRSVVSDSYTTTNIMAMITTASDLMTNTPNTTSMAMITTANTPITNSTELGGGGGNWNCHGIKADNKVLSTS